jgi:hypothetical protein
LLANEPKGPDRTEAFPSTTGALSGAASANAPFIYWDLIGAYGIFQGVGHLTLEVARHSLPRPFPWSIR